jgi:oxalate decarboxylase/phosphoglucose isomerase-like protein (cupin superfamily)
MGIPQPISPFDLERTYVHLSDGPDAKRVDVTPTFWQTIATNPDLRGGRMVTAHRFSEDWEHWEMHPAGEELVVLSSGAIDLVLEEASGSHTTLSLRGRGAVLIPRGTWHWARVHEPSEMWFVTYGEGTQHRGL